MNELNYLLSKKTEFLKYLKTKIHLYHMSNVFFRDVHYGVMSYLSDQGKNVAYGNAEKIATQVAEVFEKDGIFKKWITNRGFCSIPNLHCRVLKRKYCNEEYDYRNKHS